MDWIENNYYLKGIMNRLDHLSIPVRIAGFDLDDTLIYRPKRVSKSDKIKLLDSSIPNKIAELVARKYLIIIFTNQAGMSINKNFSILHWRRTIEELASVLFDRVIDQPYYFAIYVAKGYDIYRKPNLGLWELMKADLILEFRLAQISISKKSFYCGDAAGRIRPGPFKKKLYPSSTSGDFSDVDRKFALNLRIDFLTPEEFLMKNPPKMEYQLRGLNPREYLKNFQPLHYRFRPRGREMVIMVGPPGSGKTEFVRKYILPAGYVHINQDICKTKNKCLSLTEDALKNKQSVVIDGTNPDVPSRMAYTSLAKEYRYHHIRCIVIKVDIELAKHLNNVRHVYSQGLIPKIKDVVYHLFCKSFVKPMETEYFDKIEEVDFRFDPEYLNDPFWKRIFLRWSES